MKFCIHISLLLIAGSVFCQRTDISYDWQKLLTFDGASNNDSIGKFYACFSYDTIGTITFSLDSASSAYAITSTTGNIYVSNNTYLVMGYDTIKVEVCDGASCGTYYGVITVKDEDSCVFVDPDWGGTESGTLSEPYNAWSDVSSWIAGYAYLQKRGTTQVARMNVYNARGTSSKHISIGAYGTGTKPTIDRDAVDECIYIGPYGGNGCTYLDIYEFIARDGENCIRTQTANDQHHINFYNCEAINCSDNANIYLQQNLASYFTDVNYSVYNTVIYDGDNHGIKTNRTVDIINCNVYDNADQGISIHTQCTVRYCFTSGNTSAGIELQGDSSVVEKNVCYDNTLTGILHDDDHDSLWTHNIIRENETFGNRDAGMVLKANYNTIVENNLVHDNGVGHAFYPGVGIYCRYSVNNIFRYNSIYENVEGSMQIRDNGVGYYSSNDSIYYNWMSESLAKSIELLEGNGGDLYFMNNTIYLDSIFENSSNYNVTCYGNIAEYIDYDVGSNNLLMNSDSIFTDAANHDFTLNPDKATNAIDQGYDWGQTEDFAGNSKSGSEWDIGAYEFQDQNRVYTYLNGVKKKVLKNGVEVKIYKTK